MTTQSFSMGRIAPACAALAIFLLPAVADAQIRQVSSSRSEDAQAVNFTIGYFALRGLESRVSDDVLCCVGRIVAALIGARVDEV